MILLRTGVLYLMVLSVCCAQNEESDNQKHTLTSLHQLSLEQLQERRRQIDSQLDQLAEITLRSGVGNLGWQSRPRNNDEFTEWAEIYLGSDQPIDQIVLVPLLWSDTKTGIQADGFPVEFQIIAGKLGDPVGSVIATFSENDSLLPRLAPLIIPVEPITAAWIRIEATKLTPRASDGRYSLRLSEVMVFNGEENIALHQPVTLSSIHKTRVQSTDPAKALVDGFTPYLMNAAQGEKSPDFVCFFAKDVQYSLSLDLGKPLPLNRIHLHAPDREESIPHLQHADYALPRHMIVEGGHQADFSDAVTLTEYSRESIYDAGPIIHLHFPETTCRYVRFRFIEAYKAPEASESFRGIGFTEIELFSRSQNVALNKSFQDAFESTSPERKASEGKLTALTDGRNHYGSILPTKSWLNQLALRHQLEVELPLISTELNTRYVRQKRNLTLMYWVSGALAAATVLIILIDRILRLRHVARVKQRFAADLHDELGANLHAIGLISDVAQHANSKEQWQTLGQRIRELTERTGAAAHHCTDLLEAKGLYIGLTSDMRRAAERITTNLKHEITIEGEPYLERLEPRKRIDLFLFYKECLVNIMRHAGATRISTNLMADDHEILLTIYDNGKGLPEAIHQEAPPSLQRRAQLLKAHLTLEKPPTGGTCIHLRVSNRRTLFQKLKSLLPDKPRKRVTSHNR